MADLYGQESFIDEIILYSGQSPWRTGHELRARGFDCAILLQNAFEAAWIAWLARIPTRIGYKRDGRQLLLTRAVDVPKPGEIPRHERFYYLEMLRRAGLIDALPASEAIRLHSVASPNGKRVIGVSPGAAYGTAKRWLPERFAEAAGALATARGASIALFGSKTERELCEEVAQRLNGHQVTDYAGQTTLAQFIDLRLGLRIVPDERFRLHAHRFGARRADGRDFRRNRRYHHGTHRIECTCDSASRRLQSVFIARMPDRPSLHDRRQRRARGPRSTPIARLVSKDS